MEEMHKASPGIGPEVFLREVSQVQSRPAQCTYIYTHTHTLCMYVCVCHTHTLCMCVCVWVWVGGWVYEVFLREVSQVDIRPAQCTYIHIYIYIYIYIYTHSLSLYVCVCVCTTFCCGKCHKLHNVHIYAHTHYMYVCMYVCMHACMHACLHVCMYE